MTDRSTGGREQDEFSREFTHSQLQINQLTTQHTLTALQCRCRVLFFTVLLLKELLLQNSCRVALQDQTHAIRLAAVSRSKYDSHRHDALRYLITPKQERIRDDLNFSD